MTFTDFCSYSYDFLLKNKPEALSKEELDSFINNPDYVCSDLKDVYRAFVSTMQDYQARPRIINYSKRSKEINSVLCDLDCSYVLKKYNSDTLLKAFSSLFKINNIESKNNAWRQYSISLIDGAKFLSSFHDYDSFKDFINAFSQNALTKESLPLLLGKEIHGMGLALACDWLKEIGCVDYPKPDTHMIDVFFKAGFAEKDPWSCFKAAIRVAEEGRITPYSLDKIIWLICSGNFYRYGIHIKPLKQKYIDSLNNK
jgi:hypothetical protein